MAGVLRGVTGSRRMGNPLRARPESARVGRTRVSARMATSGRTRCWPCGALVHAIESQCSKGGVDDDERTHGIGVMPGRGGDLSATHSRCPQRGRVHESQGHQRVEDFLFGARRRVSAGLSRRGGKTALPPPKRLVGHRCRPPVSCTQRIHVTSFASRRVHSDRAARAHPPRKKKTSTSLGGYSVQRWIRRSLRPIVTGAHICGSVGEGCQGGHGAKLMTHLNGMGGAPR